MNAICACTNGSSLAQYPDVQYIGTNFYIGLCFEERLAPLSCIDYGT